MKTSAARRAIPAVEKILQALGDTGLELRSVREGEPGSLLGHGAADGGDAVTDGHHSRSTGGVQISLAIGGEDPAPLAADSLRVGLAKAAGKNRLGHGAVVSATPPAVLSS